MRTTKQRQAGDRGEIMLEATFILVSVLILLMALLSIAFLFYQEAIMNCVATEIAADVAKNAKFTDLAIGSNELTSTDYEDTQMFLANFGKGTLEKAKKRLIEEYLVDRMALASFGINAGDFNTSCEFVSSGIGRMYVVVTVSQPSEFFLSGILDMLGVAPKETLFSATAYAECTDLMTYTSTVNFTDYTTGKLGVIESVGELYSSVKKFVSALIE